MSEAPAFWWKKPDWRALALSPLSALYGAVARRRLLHAVPPEMPAPVLCIGNFTVGGAGKTPTAIALAKAAQALGLTPGIVSRGYGGAFSGVHRVDPSNDTATLTGDEPLLLARHAPVAVSVDRAAAARLLISEGCDFLIMDDGFQSARLYIDYALLVVDTTRGIGNGRVIPAGPLRAPLADQLRKADALLKIGAGNAAAEVFQQAAKIGKPAYTARLGPSSTARISGRRFLAFAGIGNPDKFFASLGEMGGVPALTRSFSDHHPYTQDEIGELMQTAAAGDLELVTTAKDHVRLVTAPGTPQRFLDKLRVIDIELVFDQSDITGRIIEAARERYHQRIKG
ncbi:tetraacyldisaccharide 4'-kinase [Phyllobacterium leguminum]|uniref:Tetraacyldisaccharide 4'-kinase n=1 Tax=Phyllobacterium leguminum TaxID=314237 RepID=A0A318T9U8_9HYPH|nr:tetraacyldisaccharide 4'-kinase [Phyllobacterium leguminum]PYE90427.1 lipid-A-disaccharide kinase [Phyllobacterium leguminum]